MTRGQRHKNYSRQNISAMWRLFRLPYFIYGKVGHYFSQSIKFVGGRIFNRLCSLQILSFLIPGQICVNRYHFIFIFINITVQMDRLVTKKWIMPKPYQLSGTAPSILSRKNIKDQSSFLKPKTSGPTKSLLSKSHILPTNQPLSISSKNNIIGPTQLSFFPKPNTIAATQSPFSSKFHFFQL